MIVLGTRQSALALVQTQRVHDALVRAGHDVRQERIHTQGDLQLDRPLRELEGKGFFTKELDEALLCGKVHAAVHSFKDLPTDLPDGLALIAVLERDDPCDAILVRPRFLESAARAHGPLPALRAGTRVGTTSLRRRSQVLAHFPDVVVADVRGNVPTRVEKLRRGDYDALVLAAAGLDRLALDLSDLHVHRFDPSHFLPAPGQGAIAVTARADDAATARALAVLRHAGTERCTRAERGVLARFEGGCHLPLGTYAVAEGEELHLRACWESEGVLVRADVRAADPDDAAARAEAALRGARAVVREREAGS